MVVVVVPWGAGRAEMRGRRRRRVVEGRMVAAGRTSAGGVVRGGVRGGVKMVMGW